jgi:hypothetical protein
MNTNLQNVLLSALEKAQKVGGDIVDASKTGAEKTFDFLKEQIPDVLAQLLRWEFAYHLIWALILLTIFGLFSWIVKRCFRAFQKAGGFDSEDAVGFFIGGLVIFVISSFLLFAGLRQATHCVKIAVAPKLFLIDYCSELVHSAKDPNFKRTHNH